MENLTVTVILSVILVALAIGGLAIGLIVTGKSRLRVCGRRPLKKRDETCGKTRHCPLCDADKKPDRRD